MFALSAMAQNACSAGSYALNSMEIQRTACRSPLAAQFVAHRDPLDMKGLAAAAAWHTLLMWLQQ